jgi:hypothetical protein
MPFDKSPASFFGSMYGVDANNRMTFQLEGANVPEGGGAISVDDQMEITLTRASSVGAISITDGTRLDFNIIFVGGTVPTGLSVDTIYGNCRGVRMADGVDEGKTYIFSQGPYTAGSYTAKAYLFDEGSQAYDGGVYTGSVVLGDEDYILMPYGSYFFNTNDRIITAIGGLAIDDVYWVVGVSYVTENTCKIQISSTQGGAAITGLAVSASGAVYRLHRSNPVGGFDVSVDTIRQITFDAGDYQSSAIVGAKITTSSTGTFPAGISASTDYWIVDSINDKITVSASLGGADITGFTAGLYTGTAQLILPSGSGGTLSKVAFPDADPLNGDWRIVAFALLDEIANKFKALETANKPARFTCSKKTTGSDDVMVRSYTFSMNLTPPNPAEETVLDEP